MSGWANSQKGWFYSTREKYGAQVALEIYEKVQLIDDRVKTLTNTILTTFSLEGNDAETIGKAIDILDEITRTEYNILERSSTINRRKVTQCPFKTGYEDVSEWPLIFFNIVSKTINPKATLERPKGMCAGDSYCEYVWKLDESERCKEAVKSVVKELVIPWKLKYDIAFKGWVSSLRGYFHAVREKYGATISLEMYERMCRMGDRIKNAANKFRTIFNIEGNDATTIGDVIAIWLQLSGIEYTIPEHSKAISRHLITKCPWATDYKDISDWDLNTFVSIVAKTINSKATVEQHKNMCAGDSYCEFVYKIEE
jgi:hypothetical protein